VDTGVIATAPDPTALDPAATVLARLNEPGTAESLHRLLDHLDLLAILVVGLDGLLRRGDTIAESLGSAVREVIPADGPPVDIGQLLSLGQQSVAAAPALLAMLPVVERVAASDLGDPRLVDLASAVSRAAVTAAADADTGRMKGVRALWRAYRDEDVARALAFTVSVAKALGRELDQTPTPDRKEH
jgi:hypothetical protein